MMEGYQYIFEWLLAVPRKMAPVFHWFTTPIEMPDWIKSVSTTYFGGNAIFSFMTGNYTMAVGSAGMINYINHGFTPLDLVIVIAIALALTFMTFGIARMIIRLIIGL